MHRMIESSWSRHLGFCRARMEIDEGIGIPKQFRDARGYRALLAQSKPRWHS